jgi:ribosomal protein S18 acetylase RimI-like enzyme
MNEYVALRRLPTIEEYKNICYSVGWKDYINYDVAEASLRQSLFGVVIQCAEEIVGMGRVVGDGHIYFYIQDIAVVPAHQHKGIGRLVMAEIRDYLQENAPEKSFIGLFASQGKEPFYEKYGFHRHDGMTGMFGVKHGNQIQ